jgi:hypothetical protein
MCDILGGLGIWSAETVIIRNTSLEFFIGQLLFSLFQLETSRYQL